MSIEQAVFKFTKIIEEATDKALKFEKKGKYTAAVEQWDIVIEIYQRGGDGVVLGPQALYRCAMCVSV